MGLSEKKAKTIPVGGNRDGKSRASGDVEAGCREVESMAQR
jgi:hypothetical protein